MEPTNIELMERGFNALVEALGAELSGEAWRPRGSFWQSHSVWPPAEIVLELLESHAAEVRDEWSGPRKEVDYEAIQAFLASLYFDRLAAIRISLDFDLELREFERLFQPERYPALWAMFRTLPGDRGFELDGEFHTGVSYHIHYVVMAKRRKRTNVVLTFDPSEAPGPPNTLYWYPHGRKSIHMDPEAFGPRRRATIHDCAEPFLHTVPKQNFLTPPKKAAILFPA